MSGITSLMYSWSMYFFAPPAFQMVVHHHCTGWSFKACHRVHRFRIVAQVLLVVCCVLLFLPVCRSHCNVRIVTRLAVQRSVIQLVALCFNTVYIYPQGNCILQKMFLFKTQRFITDPATIHIGICSLSYINSSDVYLVNN